MGQNRHLGIRTSPATRRTWARCMALWRACDDRGGEADRLLRSALTNMESVLSRRCREKGLDLAAALRASADPRATRVWETTVPRPVVD